MSGEGEHPLSGKLNLCKSRKANSTPRLAGGKRAAPGKLHLRLRWAQGMVSVYLLWLAGVVPPVADFFINPYRELELLKSLLQSEFFSQYP